MLFDSIRLRNSSPLAFPHPKSPPPRLPPAAPPTLLACASKNLQHVSAYLHARVQASSWLTPSRMLASPIRSLWISYGSLMPRSVTTTPPPPSFVPTLLWRCRWFCGEERAPVSTNSPSWCTHSRKATMPASMRRWSSMRPRGRSPEEKRSREVILGWGADEGVVLDKGDDVDDAWTGCSILSIFEVLPMGFSL